MLSFSKMKFICAWLVVFILPVFSDSQTLKVATFNLWSGLDYHGILSMGEYESPIQRERRFRVMLKGLRTEHPDVIALQEANPAHGIASRLADSLGYDAIWQRVNGGLKFGPVGIPWNLNEGLVILARKELAIELDDVWDLARGPGVFGNGFSLHAREENIALVAKIRYLGVPIFLINVHMTSVVPVDSLNDATLADILEKEGIERSEGTKYMLAYRRGEKAIERQLDLLGHYITERTSGISKIVVGDFNVPSSSPFMQRFLAKTKLFDANSLSKERVSNSWDPDKNFNIRYSRDSLDASHKRLSPLALLGALYDGHPRNIDHILVDSVFTGSSPWSVRTIFDVAEDGVFASDHYGLSAEIPVAEFLSHPIRESDSVQAVEGSELEPLPILSYDTDVGFGYGAKVFYLNPLGLNESFDLVLFNSTKGERWYRFVFSVPDFEVRQGKIYPLAFDFIADYDKYLKNSFFGVGNSSHFEDKETYTRVPLELSLVVSKGFSTFVVGQVGLKFKLVTNFPFSDTSRLLMILPSMNSATARYHSLFATYRYDSRNSYINPWRGFVLQGEAEYAPQSGLTNVTMGRLGGWVQYYSTIFYPKTVLAMRLGVQGLIGENLPVQVLLPIGGNQTVRGSPQDRYLDKNSAVVNAELRFPIFWRFGGIVGYDAGKVWHRPTEVDLTHWATNPVVGLRLFMDTYVVRMDLGLGKETTGFYLNFGHLF